MTTLLRATVAPSLALAVILVEVLALLAIFGGAR